MKMYDSVGIFKNVRTENSVQNPESMASIFPVDANNLQIKSCQMTEVYLTHVSSSTCRQNRLWKSIKFQIKRSNKKDRCVITLFAV